MVSKFIKRLFPSKHKRRNIFSVKVSRCVAADLLAISSALSLTFILFRVAAVVVVCVSSARHLTLIDMTCRSGSSQSLCEYRQFTWKENSAT